MVNIYSKINVAVIGCGNVARRGHLPALKGLNDIVNVKWVVDIDENKARRTARKLRIKRWTKYYYDVLKDPEVEVVIIATPTPTHAKVARDCIEAGKSVIVEKPLTLTTLEALELRDLAKSNNVAGGVVFNYRYFKSVLNAKCSILRGNLGDIFFLNSISETNFPTTWTKSKWLYHEGGVLYDYFPHMVDLSCWLLKKTPIYVRAVVGSHVKGGFIDHVSLMIVFEDDVSALLETSWLTGLYVSEIEIHGSGGLGVVDIKYDVYLEYHGGPGPIDVLRDFTLKSLSIVKGLWTGEIFLGAMALYRDYYVDNLTKFLHERRFSTTFEDGVINVAILEAAFKSGKSKRDIYIEDIIG